MWIIGVDENYQPTTPKNHLHANLSQKERSKKAMEAKNHRLMEEETSCANNGEKTLNAITSSIN